MIILQSERVEWFIESFYLLRPIGDLVTILNDPDFVRCRQFMIWDLGLSPPNAFGLPSEAKIEAHATQLEEQEGRIVKVTPKIIT